MPRDDLGSYAVFINVESTDSAIAFDVANRIKNMVKKFGIEVYGPKAMPRKRALHAYMHHETPLSSPPQHSYRLAIYTEYERMADIIHMIKNMPELNTPPLSGQTKISIQTKTTHSKPL